MLCIGTHIITGPANTARCRLLTHLNGVNGGNVFTDLSRSSDGVHTFTQLGAILPTTSTVESEFGGASIIHNSTNALQVNGNAYRWNFGIRPFTVDFWVRLIAIYGTNILCGVYDTPRVKSSWAIRHDATLKVYLSSSGIADNAILNTGITLAINTWYHICFRRPTSSGNIEFYINGIRYINTAFGNIYASNREVLLGNQYGVYPACSTYGIVGYIDEFRITSDARYPLSARFTVPNREN